MTWLYLIIAFVLFFALFKIQVPKWKKLEAFKDLEQLAYILAGVCALLWQFTLPMYLIWLLLEKFYKIYLNRTKNKNNENE